MRWVLAVTLAASATYALRLVSTRLTGRVLTPRAQRAFRLAAVSLLAALVVSNLPTTSSGHASPAAIAAMAVSVVIARWRSSAALVMTVGAVGYGLLGAVIG